jgi:hypothetical protein
MNHINKYFCTAALTVWASLSQAAVWSSTNSTVKVGGFSTTMLLSLSGDQRAVGGQVDVLIPFGFNVSVTALNGGYCSVLVSAQGYKTVRVLYASALNTLLPNAPVSYCQISLTTTAASVSSAFPMGHDECVAANATSYRCVLDLGYITVVP